MNRLRIFFAMTVFFFIAVFLYINTKKTDELSNSNLLANTARFIMPSNGYKHFIDLKKKQNLENEIKQDHINIYYKKSKWVGRIRYNDISYHSLYTIDNSKIIYNITSNDINAITFAIFNPPGSKLNYSIDIVSKGKTKKVFNKLFKEKEFFNGKITLETPLNGNYEIIFSSSGKGIGAWINPYLLKQKKKQKIVLIVVVDTLRADHTSAYGYHRKTSPNLDNLSKDSILYNNAFSTTSWTLPAHVSLFSGKNLTEHGVISPNNMISRNYPLIAEVFQKNGYITAAFTGGGFVEDSYGFFRGFQYYSNIPGNVYSMNSAERVFNHFKNYIEKYENNDLFIFLHTYQVHAPYKAPRNYINRINKEVKGNLLGITNFLKDKKHYFKSIKEEDKQLLIDLYDASILYTDEVLIGKVIKLLKKKGVYKDSIIAVLSDHGEEFYEHGSWEHGHTVYSELIKIPLIIKFPQSADNSKKGIDDENISISDISGIILQSSGIDKNEERKFKVRRNDADYLIPVLLPSSPIIKQIFPKISFVKDDIHFIYNKTDKRTGTFFDPLPPKVSIYEIFNFKSDIKERNNLYKTNSVNFKFYKNLVKKYLLRLEKIKKINNRKIDKKLEKKLKSLGYLGN